ncbi:hypothetical protein [Catellatospora sp. NPDC049609]|uniref:hypothetical protein n=1 Tax=Catellatospora sp. NPDC049609 TaxID=3155505 RepID=UPI00341A5EE6
MSALTAAYRVRTQRDSVKQITAALTHAAKAGLVPPSWQIGIDGFAGDVSSLGNDEAAVRANFTAWAKYFGASVWPERTADGMTKLSAHNQQKRVAIRATIFHPEEV